MHKNIFNNSIGNANDAEGNILKNMCNTNSPRSESKGTLFGRIVALFVLAILSVSLANNNNYYAVYNYVEVAASSAGNNNNTSANQSSSVVESPSSGGSNGTIVSLESPTTNGETNVADGDVSGADDVGGDDTGNTNKDDAPSEEEDAESSAQPAPETQAEDDDVGPNLPELPFNQRPEIPNEPVVQGLPQEEESGEDLSTEEEAPPVNEAKCPEGQVPNPSGADPPCVTPEEGRSFGVAPVRPPGLEVVCGEGTVPNPSGADPPCVTPLSPGEGVFFQEQPCPWNNGAQVRNDAGECEALECPEPYELNTDDVGPACLVPPPRPPLCDDCEIAGIVLPLPSGWCRDEVTQGIYPC